MYIKLNKYCFKAILAPLVRYMGASLQKLDKKIGLTASLHRGRYTAAWVGGACALADAQRSTCQAVRHDSLHPRSLTIKPNFFLNHQNPVHHQVLIQHCFHHLRHPVQQEHQEACHGRNSCMQKRLPEGKAQ